MTTEKILFALLRTAVFDAPLDEQVLALCTPDSLQNVYTLAKAHDVAHLMGKALGDAGLPECEAITKSRNKMLQAAYRYVQQDYEYQQLCAILAEAGIAYIPLKGTVLRPYYPEPWMRTSCDTDILVHREDLEKAQTLLQEKLHFVERRLSPHDVSLITPSNNLVELHFAIVEDFVLPKAREILDKVWDYAVPVDGRPCEYALPDDLFYYYHMVHMAKHVANGGCSIRFFLDTWMLNHRIPHDRKAREDFLTKGYRMTFAKAAEQLAEVWFTQAEGDELTAHFANYILRGGDFGTLTNRVALRRAKEGGKFRSLMRRIILPYDLIKYYFPILQKHKWLTPWYQLVRWFNLLTKGDVKHSVMEARTIAKFEETGNVSAELLLTHLGLDE